MTNTFLVRSLTVFSVVLGLYLAFCIGLFPTGSLSAILLALASLIQFANFGFLIHIQTKNQN